MCYGARAGNPPLPCSHVSEDTTVLHSYNFLPGTIIADAEPEAYVRLLRHTTPA